jgi:hypothetical protein
MYIKLIKGERIALISENNDKLIKKFLNKGFELFTEKNNSDNVNNNDIIQNEEVKTNVVKRGRKNKEVK